MRIPFWLRYRLIRIRQLVLLRIGYTYDGMKLGRDHCGCGRYGWVPDRRSPPTLEPIGVDDQGDTIHACLCEHCGLPYGIERFETPQIAPVPMPTVSGFHREHLRMRRSRGTARRGRRR